MTGLGIIDTDLCMWAGTLSAADIEVALHTTGHPTLKAKPGPVEFALSGWEAWLCRFNVWVDSNPILAGGVIAAGYLLLRRRAGRTKK